MRVNCIGPLWLINAILPSMKLNGYGKIINLSSVGGGITAFPGFNLADGMSKAAIAFMTKQLAAELIYTNVEVFAICPGATETDMFTASTLSKMSEIELRDFKENLPKKALIQPEQIADIIYFLSQPMGKVMHGAVIDASYGLGVNPSPCINIQSLK